MIDFSKFNQKDEDAESYKTECDRVSAAFREYGLVIVRDPRVSEDDNNTFIDMMEKYFGLSDGVRDARPDKAFQVGVTPEATERPKNHCE